jgi:hypothetical protein
MMRADEGLGRVYGTRCDEAAPIHPVIPSLSRDLEGHVAPKKPRRSRKRHGVLGVDGTVDTPPPSRFLDKLGMTGCTGCIGASS